MLFDTHVNLHGEAFAEDRADVLARARANGVTRFMAICDKLESFADIRALADAESDMWCTVGVHPHYAKDYPGLDAATLIERAASPKVAAIGETGLDQYYGHSDLDVQVRSLETHIEAAQETDLPIVIHTRECDDETGDVLERAHARKPFDILMHCYTGGQRLADRAVDLGAVFSVSGILTFKSAKAVRDVIATVPPDRIILETDCPYLAPVPMRGRRNEPAYLTHICAYLADLLGIPVEDAARMTTDTALRLFRRVQ